MSKYIYGQRNAYMNKETKKEQWKKGESKPENKIKYIVELISVRIFFPKK